MPNISQITLPNGTTYDIKDAWARSQIEAITGGSAVVFKGVSSTPLTDGGNEKPTVNNTVVDQKNTGDLYFYNKEEFIYGDDNTWHSLGPQDQSLGDLAYRNTATAAYTPQGSITGGTFSGSQSSVAFSILANTNGNYTPAGTITNGAFTGSQLTSTTTYTPQGSVGVTVSTANKSTTVTTATTSASAPATFTPSGSVTKPIISVATAGSTTTVKAVNSVANLVSTVNTALPSTANLVSLPVTYCSVTSETLSLHQIGISTSASLTTSNVTVKTGDASYTAGAQTFSGNSVRLVTGNIAVTTAASGSFNGTNATISVVGTPAGSMAASTFSGTKVLISGNTTAAGSVSNLGFSGTATTIQVS